MKMAKGTLALLLSIGLTTPALAHPHVMDLLTEQATNGIAFASKYQNQPVVVDDYVIVSTASPSGVGSISVGAKPDRFGFPPHASAMCVLMDDQSIKAFGSLNKGDHIILTGKFSTMQGSIITLTNCTFSMATGK